MVPTRNAAIVDPAAILSARTYRGPPTAFAARRHGSSCFSTNHAAPNPPASETRTRALLWRTMYPPTVIRKITYCRWPIVLAMRSAWAFSGPRPRQDLFSGPLKCGEGPGITPGAFSFSEVRFRPFPSRGLILNLPTKLEIIGLGVTVLILLGVAALMLWRS